MAIDPHLRILNGAMSQQDRSDGAPAPEAFQVDGRSLAELLAFAAPYGALIKFYDLDNEASGDWGAFFASDPAVRLAMHAALDLPEIEHALQRLLARARNATVPERRLFNIHRVLATVSRLMNVLDRTSPGPGDGETQLRAHRGVARGDMLAEPLQRYHGHVGARSIGSALGEGAGASGWGASGWGDTLVDILEDVAITLVGELRRGTAAALAELETSLHSGGHAPQAALWNAFVQLFIEARHTLNGFPQRLVHFYFSAVLKQHSIAAEPDQLFLTFTPAQAANQASVSRGAVFPAGTDADGTPITYTADTSLEVTATTVTQLSVHRVTTAPIGHDGSISATSGVLSGEVQLDPAAPESMDPFPIFGESTTGSFGPLKMKAASMGFSVASPTLMLAGGERKISIGLVVSQHSFVHSSVAAMAATELGATTGAIAATSGDLVAFVARLLQETFELNYTTAGGWVTVETFTVLPIDGMATMFVIGFDLPDDAPPLVPLATKPGANAPATMLPADAFPDPQQQATVVGSLRSGPSSAETQKMWAAINQFAIVSRLEISEVTIDVTVDGLTDLKLSTPNGPADTSQNFALFGLPPTQHAALDITAPELFAKPLDRLSVAITWAGLPVTKTGFSGYYQDYMLDADGQVSPVPLFDNARFRATFGVVNAGPWVVDTNLPQPLFATTPPAPPQPPASGVAPPPPEPMLAAPLDQTIVLDAPVRPLDGPPPYYNATTSALRLTLAEPGYAFGNILYPSNLMAASIAQGGAGVGARLSGGAGPGATKLLATVATVNATATDKDYRQSVAPAADAAISALTGDALAAVRQAIAHGGAPASEQATLNASLDTALAETNAKPASLWARLTARGQQPEGASVVLANLSAWLSAHQDSMGAGATVPLKLAHAILDAASGIAAAQTAAADQPPAVARPNMAAAVQAAQAILLPPAIPNPPWMPMASALSVSYSASARFSLAAPMAGADLPSSIVSLAAAPVQPVVPQGGFGHLAPFDRLTMAEGNSVNLLPQVDPDPALYILLANPAAQVSLLFILAAGPDGWWSDQPDVIWEEHREAGWKPVTVLDDGTKGLANSGIVRLELKPDDPCKTRLRVRAKGNTDKAPLVKAVIANALSASWAGPGGAATLGFPLPQNTISKSDTSLTNIGSIIQPMQSFGGRPPAKGDDFQMWMAERLRHKGYAVDSWDYARLTLEAEPSLWQAAVIPGTGSVDGLPAPGHVWIVAVPGANTPNVTDPTVPMADLTMLSDIGKMLEECAGPFVQVSVTNPPYLRLQVDARLQFSDDDTSEYWEIQLGKDLVKWLSPWPDPTLGPRPDNYYTRRAVTEFVRHRPYVRSILHLEIAPEPGQPAMRWYYFTSAQTHKLSGSGAYVMPATPSVTGIAGYGA